MSSVTAPDWLHPLLGDEPGSRFLVGGVGHLLLNREEEAIVTAALEARVLPLLQEMAGRRPITLFTGLAPGADVLLMDRASSWFSRNGLALRKVAVCPVPPELLIADWIESAEKNGYTLSRADLLHLQTALDTTLQHCDAVVRLYDLPAAKPLQTSLQRQLQYQQLGALLAQYSDVLVAVLHDEREIVPGGTAEVVAWRRQPSKIPPHLSIASTLRPMPQDAGLIVINPMPAKVTMSGASGDSRANKALQAARKASDSGNELLSNDILYRALKQGLQHPDLHYLRVRALASIGSSELALREYQELAPPPEAREERWVTLLGRIKKDQGLRDHSQPHFRESANAYLDAWQRFGSSYSLINAATMLTLCQDPTRARALAQQVPQHVEQETAANDVARYYAAATHAEAALILGDSAAVTCHLREANCLLPLQAPERTGTLRQLRMLCATLNVEVDLLSPLQLPPLILLRRFGHPELGSRDPIDTRWLAELPSIARIFMGVCDCVDLMLAETLIQQGQLVHLLLPYRADRLVKSIRRSYGEDWAQRLTSCLEQAVQVHTERGFLGPELDWAASNVTQNGLGLSLLAAQRAGGQLRIVNVDPLQLMPAFADAACFDEHPQRAARARAHIYQQEPPTLHPEGRRMVGLIFADFAGFQRLEDRELPYFWQGIMRDISALLVPHHDAILLRHTWGDALHVVTRDAGTAARIMADIQQYLDLHRLKPDSPLSSLTLRIAGHYAPAFEGYDPIREGPTYYGTQLSLTARIEPVTPPGQIYVTEAFAARLALEADDQFALEYTGEVELAKRFGVYRLYALRRLRA